MRNIYIVIKILKRSFFHQPTTGINERSVLAAATLFELDDVYNRKRLGFKTLDEMYRSWSSKT